MSHLVAEDTDLDERVVQVYEQSLSFFKALERLVWNLVYFLCHLGGKGEHRFHGDLLWLNAFRLHVMESQVVVVKVQKFEFSLCRKLRLLDYFQEFEL